MGGFHRGCFCALRALGAIGGCKSSDAIASVAGCLGIQIHLQHTETKYGGWWHTP